MKYIKEYNENKSERFFFSQDCSSHWYMIPLSLKSEWDRLNTDDEDDYDTIDEFSKLFSQYMTGGGITHITFENPEKMK